MLDEYERRKGRPTPPCSPIVEVHVECDEIGDDDDVDLLDDDMLGVSDMISHMSPTHPMHVETCVEIEEL
jgi:hypothetical protein